MTDQEKLLNDLVTARHYCYSRLMDESRERGEEWEALVWEWLRDRNKYPSLRYDSKYGWSFVADKGLLNSKQSPTTLPRDLYEKELISTKTYNTAEEALHTAMRALATWLEGK